MFIWENLADNDCGGARGQKNWYSQGKICKQHQDRGKYIIREMHDERTKL